MKGNTCDWLPGFVFIAALSGLRRAARFARSNFTGAERIALGLAHDPRHRLLWELYGQIGCPALPFIYSVGPSGPTPR